MKSDTGKKQISDELIVNAMPFEIGKVCGSFFEDEKAEEEMEKRRIKKQKDEEEKVYSLSLTKKTPKPSKYAIRN